MNKQFLVAIGVVVPLLASAVTIQPGDLYSDVSPTSVEAVGINLLSRANIVQGIGDGYFAPTRAVNRAEFLKIAILATPASNRPSTVPRNCFVDVREADWFSGTVCGAKELGIVRGNADITKPESEWLFAPATTVTYDAALKILSLLFDYNVRDEVSGEAWGQRYYEAAREQSTDLPLLITFDTPLTRAMAARLVAGFLAESEGQLQEFRSAEAGQYTSSLSSSTSSSESSSSSSESSSSSSSSVASQPQYSLPITSHFLLVGAVSDAIAGGVFSPISEDTELLAVQLKLFQEARALEKLELVKEDGTVLATLKWHTNTDITDYRLTYDVFLTGDAVYTISKDTTMNLFIRAVVRSKANDGFSENLVHVRQFALTLRGKDTNQTYNIPFTGPFPKHQTALARVHSVMRTSPLTKVLATEEKAEISSFALSSDQVDLQPVSLVQMVFGYERVGNKSTLTDWKLIRKDSNAQASCTENPSAKTISCANLQTIFGMLPKEPTTLSLVANIQTEASALGEWFQVSLPVTGSPEVLGSLWWTDATGTFRWIEGQSPIAAGTKLSN